MTRFLGASYTRTGIDLLDKGAVRAAIWRYVETGNADEMRTVLNEPWAKTKAGQEIVAEMLDEARKEMAEKKAKAKKRKEEEENDPYAPFRDAGGWW